MHTVYPITTFNSAISYPSSDYPVPTYTSGTATEISNGWAFNTASPVMLHLPDWSNGVGRPAIIACHGLNQTASSTFAPGTGRWGDYTRALVDAGFVILSMDLGAQHFGNNLTMQLLDQAYAYLTGLTGGAKVGLLGSSAGALSCLSWSRKWPARVGGIYLLNGYVDFESARGDTGWTLPYSVSAGDPNADLYPGLVAGGSGTGDPTSTNGAFKCTDAASFATNATNQGHVPARYPTDWSGHNIVLASAHRDPTLPYQAAQWWASAVGSPTVKFRAVTYTGAAHEPGSLLGGADTDAATAAAGGLPRSELRDFFHAVL